MLTCCPAAQLAEGVAPDGTRNNMAIFKGLFQEFAAASSTWEVSLKQ